jgi:aspartate racemase
MLSEVRQAIDARGLRRIGILGTRTVMETRFYGSIRGAEILPPAGPDLDAVHEAYVTMAAAGVVTEEQRSVFYAASNRLIEAQGAEAIMLGGTDLALAFDEKTSPFPLVNCAAIHADALVQLALG